MSDKPSREEVNNALDTLRSILLRQLGQALGINVSLPSLDRFSPTRSRQIAEEVAAALSGSER